ncbi:MAG: FAD:protein FMN transferase [Bacillota bacterium]|nr:FAD:protein FMN transferase [Bacillota bacterium]
MKRRDLRGSRQDLSLDWLYAVALVSAFTVAGCQLSANKPVASVRTGFALGTLVQVRAYASGEGAGKAVDEAFHRIEEIEALMSANIASSDVAELNRNAGGLPSSVAGDTLYVVKRAKEYADLSNGKFDVAIGPLVQLWGIGTKHAKVPSPEDIAVAKQLVHHGEVEVDESGGTVRLPKAGMALDLGAIAKGYAADEAAEVLTERGVESAFIDLGGNILVVGSRPDGSPWRVGIQDPWKERGATFAVLSVRDTAVVSSGTYERFFEQHGRRYHHIIDPDTGYPAETGVVSATIVARRAVDADALSTAVFLLGPSDGMGLVERLPGIEAVIVTEVREVLVSPGLKGAIEISDGWTVKYHDGEDVQES